MVSCNPGHVQMNLICRRQVNKLPAREELILPLLEIQNVSKTYDNITKALQDVSLDIS
jgi:hypothetical protein